MAEVLRPSRRIPAALRHASALSQEEPEGVETGRDISFAADHPWGLGAGSEGTHQRWVVRFHTILCS